jgi:hypothetical protein
LAGAKVMRRSSGSPVAAATAFGLTGADKLIVPRPWTACRYVGTAKMVSTSLWIWAAVITEGPTRAATEPLLTDVVVEERDQTAAAAPQVASRIRPAAQVVGRNSRGWRGRRTPS